jgi:hypothetical protein
MQAQREYPPSLEDVKDKFLVQSTVASPDTREVGADTFDPTTNKTIRQTKLRVLLVGDRLHERVWDCTRMAPSVPSLQQMCVT